jgi:hypothetical protein
MGEEGLCEDGTLLLSLICVTEDAAEAEALIDTFTMHLVMCECCKLTTARMVN